MNVKNPEFKPGEKAGEETGAGVVDKNALPLRGYWQLEPFLCDLNWTTRTR